MIVEGIKQLLEGKDLPTDLAQATMREIMLGSATPSQIASFVTALRMKGETGPELAAMAYIMREFSNRIHPKVHGRLIDTCGTGGGRIRTFNVSTIAAFVAAGAGVKIAKHGNRSFSGLCGSADLLEQLGLDLTVSPHQVEKAIETHGIGFMFAPNFHPAMKHASLPRREIEIRTVFNLLGPLTNPANAEAQLLGVSEKEMVEMMAKALVELDCIEAMVVYGEGGLDEFSTVGPTYTALLKDKQVSFHQYLPEDLGLQRCDARHLVGGGPAENAALTLRILGGMERGPKTDIVAANAAAAILVGGRVEKLREGVQVARESLKSGAAERKLELLIRSCGFPAKFEEVKGTVG